MIHRLSFAVATTAILAASLPLLVQSQQPPGKDQETAVVEAIPADEQTNSIREFAQFVGELESTGASLEKLGGAERAFAGVPAVPAETPTDKQRDGTTRPNPPTLVTVEGATPPLSSLFVWVRGSWSYRSDMFYQSKTYATQVWVTIGKKADGPQWSVDKLEGSFTSPCDSLSRSWANTSRDGFKYTQTHKGLFPPGQGMCFPVRGQVRYTGCATYKGVRWCAKTTA